MTDGITLGHPRCAVPTCREPLGNNRHRFCASHFYKHNECAVRTCSDPVIPGSKMCSDPQHRKMESLNKSCSEAPFQLAKRMQRLQVSHPNNSMLEDISESPAAEPDDLEENIEWFEVEGNDDDDVRIYNEHNPGGIGTEDVVEDEGLLVAGNSQAIVGLIFIFYFILQLQRQQMSLLALHHREQKRTCTEVERIMSRP